MIPFRSVIFLSAIAVSLLSACRAEGKGTIKEQEENAVVIPSSTDNNRELDMADTLDRRDTAKYPSMDGKP
ncbi:MAG: hypothetical protein ACOH13_09110 [Flavobacteriales bacterium]